MLVIRKTGASLQRGRGQRPCGWLRGHGQAAGRPEATSEQEYNLLNLHIYVTLLLLCVIDLSLSCFRNLTDEQARWVAFGVNVCEMMRVQSFPLSVTVLLRKWLVQTKYIRYQICLCTLVLHYRQRQTGSWRWFCWCRRWSCWCRRASGKGCSLWLPPSSPCFQPRCSEREKSKSLPNRIHVVVSLWYFFAAHDIFVQVKNNIICALLLRWHYAARKLKYQMVSMVSSTNLTHWISWNVIVYSTELQIILDDGTSSALAASPPVNPPGSCSFLLIRMRTPTSVMIIHWVSFPSQG